MFLRMLKQPLVGQGILTVEAARSHSNWHKSRSQSGTPQGHKETRLKVTIRLKPQGHNQRDTPQVLNQRGTPQCDIQRDTSQGHSQIDTPQGHIKVGTSRGHNQTRLKATIKETHLKVTIKETHHTPDLGYSHYVREFLTDLRRNGLLWKTPSLLKVVLYRRALKNGFVSQISQDFEVLRLEDIQRYPRTQNWHFSRKTPKEALTNRLVVTFNPLISSPGQVP